MHAGKEFIKVFLTRVWNIFTRPRNEWLEIRDEPKTYSDVIFRYVAIIAAIPPAAAAIDGIVFSRTTAKPGILTFLRCLLLPNLLWYGISIINVVITGVIITAVVKASEARWDGIQGLKIAAYSFTPLFMAGLFADNAGMNWIVYAAILYSIYLVYLGIIGLAATGRKQAVGCAIVSFLSASIILGVMNLLEYFFETTLLNKIVS